MTLQEWFTDKSKWKQIYGPAFNWPSSEAKCLDFAIRDLIPSERVEEVRVKIADMVSPGWPKDAINTSTSAGWAIAVWNDADDRTFADIQRVVKEANE